MVVSVEQLEEITIR